MAKSTRKPSSRPKRLAKPKPEVKAAAPEEVSDKPKLAVGEVRIAKDVQSGRIDMKYARAGDVVKIISKNGDVFILENNNKQRFPAHMDDLESESIVDK